MDRLDAMTILLAAVETGSLSAASRQRGIPLATVSRKIAELEGHLGTRLLHRTNRQVTLTDAGRAYVDACRRILEEVDEAERAVAGEYSAPKGELSVTAPVVFGRLHVLPVVVGFLQAYREIDLRLVLTDRVVSLTEDHVDVAVRIGALPDSNLIAVKVGSIRRVVCASPAYLARRGTPATPQALRGHDCVTFEGLGSPRAWTFTGRKGELSVPIHSRLSVTTAEAALDAAVAGLGVTRVLSYQAAAVRDGGLAVVLEAFEPAPWPVHLIYVGQGLLPGKLRAFLDFATPGLRARIG